MSDMLHNSSYNSAQQVLLVFVNQAAKYRNNKIAGNLKSHVHLLLNLTLVLPHSMEGQKDCAGNQKSFTFVLPKERSCEILGRSLASISSYVKENESSRPKDQQSRYL